MKSPFFLSGVIIFLTYNMPGAYSVNILAIFPTPSISHQVSCLGFLKGLVSRGHNVTVITTDPNLIDERPSNYHVIDGSVNYLVWHNYMSIYKIDLQKERSPFETLKHFEYVFAEFIETIILLEDTQNLLVSPQTKFDLIMYEGLYPAALGIGKHFGGIPTVAIATVPNYLTVEKSLGNPVFTSYMPTFITDASDHMSLFERLQNMFYYYYTSFIQYYYAYPLQDAIVKKHFGENMTHVADLEKNNSLYLMSGDLSQSYPVPRQPNTIQVGICHIQSRKPLPKDLKLWMDGAKEGVIYFSLGSNMKGTSLRPELRKVFIDVFKKFPNHRVIWKWESDTPFAGKPENVLLRKWNPQQDILAHPKTVLFISQAGHQSRQEAIYYGVPMLLFPLFWDQDYNAKKIVLEGAGLSINVEQLNNETLYKKMEAILIKPSFKENMLRLSSITKDQPMNCQEKVAWWVEYVLRHKGAAHLKPASLDLYWYQLYNVDIILIIIVLLSFFSTTQVIFTRFYNNHLFKSKYKEH